jgi:hypothetical protein
MTVYKGKSLAGQKVEPLQYREVERNGVVGQEWHRPKPRACLAEAQDLMVGDLAERLVPLKRTAEEILHEMERLAYYTRYGSMDRSTGEYREIDPAVLMFTAETMRRLAMELVR